MENKKKITKNDIERRMRNAIVLVPRDKDYQGVYFDDKGLRVEITQDFAVISTNFHRHVFNSFTAAGVSRPYLYTRRLIDLANDNDCMVKDEKGNVTRSYVKLMSVLQAKADKSEYNVAWYIDLWLSNIFAPLYGIGESEAEAFLCYERYLHNIAHNYVLLSEKTDDMTNVDFVNKVMENEREFIKDMDVRVIFPKKTDDELRAENAQAVDEHETAKFMEGQADEN